jgi:hypothetical protein
MTTVDLSKLAERQTTQARITNNRDTVIPRARTNTPAVQVFADMRNAARGNDVDEVRRALGLVDQAVGAVVDMRQAAAAEQAGRDATAAALDAAQGKPIDPVQAAKSQAFQEAYELVSSDQKQAAWQAEVEAKAMAMVNQGADTEDLEAYFKGSVTAYAEATKSLYSTDITRRRVAQRTTDFLDTLQPKLLSGIKARVQAEVVDARAATVSAAAKDGRPVDFEASIKPLLDLGISPAAAKDAIRSTLSAVALDPQDPRPDILASLLSSTKADGTTPSLSAPEQLQVQNAYVQAEGLLKRKQQADREERQDVLTLKWFGEAEKGEVVDGEISAAVHAGTFSAQEGITLRGAFGRLRDDRLEGEASEDAVIKLELELAQRQPNYASVRAKAATLYRDGKLGTGRAAAKAYLGLMRSTAHDAQASATATRGGSTRDEVADGKWLLSQLLPVPREDGVVDPNSARAFILAKQAWRARLQKGEKPGAAADAVAKEWKDRVAGVASAAPVRPKTTLKYDSQGSLK